MSKIDRLTAKNAYPVQLFLICKQITAADQKEYGSRSKSCPKRNCKNWDSNFGSLDRSLVLSCLDQKRDL